MEIAEDVRINTCESFNGRNGPDRSVAPNQITVLKFGSSVLRDHTDVSLVLQEIYQQWRAGKKVIAVVSAWGDTTDQLLRDIQEGKLEPSDKQLAQSLAEGEEISVRRLLKKSREFGLPATCLGPYRSGLLTRGDRLDSEPVGVELDILQSALNSHDILILPGFLGKDPEGEIALLGRGGSDLSAVYLAHALDASLCRLVKDVPALFEWDPALPGPRPRRFATMTFESATRLDESIVQPKAVAFAQKRNFQFEVGALHGLLPTRVGSKKSSYVEFQPQPTRIALLGLGTVGKAVYQTLMADSHFQVVIVGVRHPEKYRNLIDATVRLTADIDELCSEDFDVFVELTGAGTAAYEWIANALRSGIPVVTANKAVLACHGSELSHLAETSRSSLRFSAAVGGGMPALETARLARLRGKPETLEAILNGTTNFILEKLRSGNSLESALKIAQAQGFAEADPQRDLSGEDARQKLTLLVREVFGEDLPREQIQLEGIDPSHTRFRNLPNTRLVARASLDNQGRVQAAVGPEPVPDGHSFRNIVEEENALLIKLVSGEHSFIRGKGAGAGPTSLAVLADLWDLHHELHFGVSSDLQP